VLLLLFWLLGFVMMKKKKRLFVSFLVCVEGKTAAFQKGWAVVIDFEKVLTSKKLLT